jgi:hypothetical protein
MCIKQYVGHWIYQYCKPTTAMVMVDHSDAFSAYLPCRIALIEDQKGEKWLYSLNMDMMIYGGPWWLRRIALAMTPYNKLRLHR